MVDFSNLLGGKVGESVKPKALPPGLYPGVIKGWEPVEAPPGKDYRTIVRISLGLTAWPDDVEDQDKSQVVKVGEPPQPIDLSKRTLRRDYYDHRMFDLDNLMAECGLEVAGLSYKESLPMLIGCPVLVEVAQYVNSRSNEIGNQVNNLRGQG